MVKGTAFKEFTAMLDYLPDATLIIDTDGVAVAWNRAMEALTGVPAKKIIGQGNYEYALPFYGERKPLLANLILSEGGELEERYHRVKKEGDTYVVDIFIPSFGETGKYFWAKATPRSTMPEGRSSGRSRRSGISPSGKRPRNTAGKVKSRAPDRGRYPEELPAGDDPAGRGF